MRGLRSGAMIGALLAMAGPVGAAESAEAGFKKWVTEWARERGRFVEMWQSANLDEDAAEEWVARLCPLEGEKNSPGGMGDFLIEDPAAEPGPGVTPQRFVLGFSVDKGTLGCLPAPAPNPRAKKPVGKPLPLLRRTKEKSFRHSVTQPASREELKIALRDGRPVIVWRREELYARGARDAGVEETEEIEEDWEGLRSSVVWRRLAGRGLRREQSTLVPVVRHAERIEKAQVVGKAPGGDKSQAGGVAYSATAVPDGPVEMVYPEDAPEPRLFALDAPLVAEEDAGGGSDPEPTRAMGRLIIPVERLRAAADSVGQAGTAIGVGAIGLSVGVAVAKKVYRVVRLPREARFPPPEAGHIAALVEDGGVKQGK